MDATTQETAATLLGVAVERMERNEATVRGVGQSWEGIRNSLAAAAAAATAGQQSRLPGGANGRPAAPTVPSGGRPASAAESASTVSVHSTASSAQAPQQTPMAAPASAVPARLPSAPAAGPPDGRHPHFHQPNNAGLPREAPSAPATAPVPGSTMTHPPPEHTLLSMSSIGFGIDSSASAKWGDATEASIRALQDAMQRSTLRLPSQTNAHSLQIKVQLGVPPKPGAASPNETMVVDVSRLTSILPRAIPVLPIRVAVGGLYIPPVGLHSPAICTAVACITLQSQAPIELDSDAKEQAPKVQPSPWASLEGKQVHATSAAAAAAPGVAGDSSSSSTSTSSYPVQHMQQQHHHHHQHVSTGQPVPPSDANALQTQLSPSAPTLNVTNTAVPNAAANVTGPEQMSVTMTAAPRPSEPNAPIGASTSTPGGMQQTGRVEQSSTSVSTMATNQQQQAQQPAKRIDPPAVPTITRPSNAHRSNSIEMLAMVSSEEMRLSTNDAAHDEVHRNAQSNLVPILAKQTSVPVTASSSSSMAVGTTSAVLHHQHSHHHTDYSSPNDSSIEDPLMRNGNYNYKKLPPGVTTKNNRRLFVRHTYRDLSNEQPWPEEQDYILAATSAARTPNAAFPLKLHETLTQIEEHGYADIIGWMPHGRSFKIFKQKEFSEIILPRYFVMTKKSSFLRQLNLYGFNRFSAGPDQGSYYHEKFLRGLKFLTRRMTRQKVNGNRIRSAGNPDEEPVLSKYPTCPPPNMQYRTASTTTTTTIPAVTTSLSTAAAPVSTGVIGSPVRTGETHTSTQIAAPATGIEEAKQTNNRGEVNERNNGNHDNDGGGGGDSAKKVHGSEGMKVC